MKHTLRCHDFGEAYLGNVPRIRYGAIFLATVRWTWAKIAPALKGLRPQSPLALSLGSQRTRVSLC